jgi:hypothetical protein
MRGDFESEQVFLSLNYPLDQYFGKFFELVNEVKASICVKSL